MSSHHYCVLIIDGLVDFFVSCTACSAPTGLKIAVWLNGCGSDCCILLCCPFRCKQPQAAISWCKNDIKLSCCMLNISQLYLNPSWPPQTSDLMKKKRLFHAVRTWGASDLSAALMQHLFFKKFFYSYFVFEHCFWTLQSLVCLGLCMRSNSDLHQKNRPWFVCEINMILTHPEPKTKTIYWMMKNWRGVCVITITTSVVKFVLH